MSEGLWLNLIEVSLQYWIVSTLDYFIDLNEIKWNDQILDYYSIPQLL